MERLFGCIGNQVVAAAAMAAVMILPLALWALPDAPVRALLLWAVTASLWIGVAWFAARALSRYLERIEQELLLRARAAVTGKTLADDARQDEVGRAVRALNALLKALESRSRRGEELVADVVHEIKSPLGAVRACAEQLRDGQPDSHRQEELAEVLDECWSRMDRRVRELLELSRAQAGLPGEVHEPFDLGAMVTALAASTGRRHPNLAIDVQSHGAQRISGITSRLETALTNVLENAASFAGPGGSVRVRIERTGEEVWVTVSDSGPGIPPELRERIFDRFVTTRPEGSGTGLGLPLTRAVLEAHGGRIWVESTPAPGATFRISLPAG